ncbi:MAG TPA: hypothetical protein PLP17_14630, partial [Oligoflexia bacterium]|nr:hypothetical protein [Oligoflexia bacterium]
MFAVRLFIAIVLPRLLPKLETDIGVAYLLEPLYWLHLVVIGQALGVTKCNRKGFCRHVGVKAGSLPNLR